MNATNEIKPVMSFSFTPEHGESWTSYVVYRLADIEALAEVKAPKIPRRFDPAWGMSFPDWDSMSPETRDAVHALADAAVRESGLYESYRGPGRAFNAAPSATIHRRTVVVRQSGGLDI